ncbi:hypothetical protein V496_08400 [Pseudogymnoascus sp. VKM F-4515 (FW-2607)]|nr:hypothetical protein V496_08400 [Pseudogymnoascus sp. VKM F-4515 (FW-2607)]
MMVGSEGPWPSQSNTPGIEEGNWASQSYNNGYQPPYTNRPHVQHPLDPKPEDIPIPSIEDDPSREPHRCVRSFRQGQGGKSEGSVYAEGEQFQQYSIRHSFRDWVWHGNGSLQLFAREITAWEQSLAMGM